MQKNNPYTEKQSVISFKMLKLLRHSNSVSVPCMFLRTWYINKNRPQQDNVLGYIERGAGLFSLLWKENDGGDKTC